MRAAQKAWPPEGQQGWGWPEARAEEAWSPIGQQEQAEGGAIMMTKEMSAIAREKHVEVYVNNLRENILKDGDGFDERIAEALADMYRHGWDDADDMIRAWGTMQ
jgi:hypothetical protein